MKWNDYIGLTPKPWPILLDHYSDDKREAVFIKDLSQFEVNTPEEVSVHIESHPIDSTTNQDISEEDGDEDLVVMEVPAPIGRNIPESGIIDIETADEGTIHWLATVILMGINEIDEKTGMEQLKNATDGNIDFTLKGTGAIPAYLEIFNLTNTSTKRAFLKEVILNNVRLGRININSKGNLMISFLGNHKLRKFLRGTSYRANNIQLSVISGAVENSQKINKGMARSVAGKSVIGKIPVLSYIIVGAIDVIEWSAQPEFERDLTDLGAQIVSDTFKMSISTMAGVFAGAITVAMFASAPVLAVVTAGLIGSILVGVALDYLDNQLGITQGVKDLINKGEKNMEKKARQENEALTQKYLQFNTDGYGHPLNLLRGVPW